MSQQQFICEGFRVMLLYPAILDAVGGVVAFEGRCCERGRAFRHVNVLCNVLAQSGTSPCYATRSPFLEDSLRVRLGFAACSMPCTAWRRVPSVGPFVNSPLITSCLSRDRCQFATFICRDPDAVGDVWRF